jgi:hypothetical protein
MAEDVLDYLKDAYSFLMDPALGEAIKEIERLRKKCDLQTMILRRLDAEKFPGTYFIHSGLGETDANGMPERLMIVPTYGADFSYIYQRTDKTTGPEW